MERESGFYWVKYYGNVWIVAQWYDNSCWLIPGNENTFDDAELDEINETKLTEPE
jgi:hypothetical protein